MTLKDSKVFNVVFVLFLALLVLAVLAVFMVLFTPAAEAMWSSEAGSMESFDFVVLLGQVFSLGFCREVFANFGHLLTIALAFSLGVIGFLIFASGDDQRDFGIMKIGTLITGIGIFVGAFGISDTLADLRKATAKTAEKKLAISNQGQQFATKATHTPLKFKGV